MRRIKTLLDFLRSFLKLISVSILTYTNVMKITEVQIIQIKPHDGLVGFASILFDDCLYLGSIGVHTRLDGQGYRITYPTKKIGDRNLNIYHPINRGLSEEIENAVLAKAALIY